MSNQASRLTSVVDTCELPLFICTHELSMHLDYSVLADVLVVMVP